MQSTSRVVLTVILGAELALAGCNTKPKGDPNKSNATRALVRQDHAACASQVAYDRLKGIVFDDAIRARGGSRVNLDTLADFSLARMEQPVVKGRDESFQRTDCQGRFVLELPPGAEHGFGGDRQLTADVTYTAQAAADGNGYVYTLRGAEDVISKLAAFNLEGSSFRPPAALDENASAEPSSIPALPVIRAEPAARPRPTVVASASERQPAVGSVPSRQRTAAGSPAVIAAVSDYTERSSSSAGADTVSAFYNALGSGNGAIASGYIVPEKRSKRAYSPEGIAGFYGRLPDPLRLTGIQRETDSAYRVTYHYSAGRTQCRGVAVVSTTVRRGQVYILGIKALKGC